MWTGARFVPAFDTPKNCPTSFRNVNEAAAGIDPIAMTTGSTMQQQERLATAVNLVVNFSAVRVGFSALVWHEQ
jgi:hypothetical protein